MIYDACVDISQTKARENIRDLAARRGWTLRQLAQRAELAEATIYNAMRRDNPASLGLNALSKLASAFGISVGELVGEESAPDVVSETITDDSPEAQRLRAELVERVNEAIARASPSVVARYYDMVVGVVEVMVRETDRVRAERKARQMGMPIGKG